MQKKGHFIWERGLGWGVSNAMSRVVGGRGCKEAWGNLLSFLFLYILLFVVVVTYFSPRFEKFIHACPFAYASYMLRKKNKNKKKKKQQHNVAPSLRLHTYMKSSKREWERERKSKRANQGLMIINLCQVIKAA